MDSDPQTTSDSTRSSSAVLSADGVHPMVITSSGSNATNAPPTAYEDQLSPLLCFSHDVLTTIFERFLNKRELSALSLTCTYLRDLCKPHLFRTCSLGLDRPITLEIVPPSSVWPYIRYLRMENKCPHPEFMRIGGWGPVYSPKEPREYAPKAELGRIYDSLIADRILHGMHNLRSINLRCDSRREGVYDISLAALQGILSLPQLREFRMANHVIYWPGPGSDIATSVQAHTDIHSFAPLTSFVYEVGMAGVPPHYPASYATQALSTVIRGLASSLEILQLPAIYTPVDALMASDWPSLRELTIQGGHGVSVDHPPTSPESLQVSSYTNMPNLRTLTLELTNGGLLWPAHHGHSVALPWPVLEHLTLSHPSPDDSVFARLPPSIRSLSLHSWPTQVYDERMKHGQMVMAAWRQLPRAPPVPSAAMLRILQACGHIAGDLTRLHIEYVVDEDEGALLRHIVSACPSLTQLEVHRFLPESMPSDPSWIVDTLGKSCAALTHLRTLYVHAALSDYPERVWIPRRARYYIDGQHTSYATGKLLEVATALARTLAPSVRTIAFLTPDNIWPRWAVYAVEHPQMSAFSVRGAENDDERVARYLEHREARR